MEEKLHFICFEHDMGEYSNGSILRIGEGATSSQEIHELENNLIELESYEGEVCNVIVVRKFIHDEVGVAHYLIRYLVNGKGHFYHTDLQYGGINSLNDIEFLQNKLAEELKVDSIVITDFELIEEIDVKKSEDD